MKRKIYFLTTVALLAMLFFACKKTTTSVPTVTSSTVTATSATTASAGGTVITEGTTPVIARGTCWSKIANPTIADSKTSDGTGTGTFTSSIAGLTPATAYHVRAYATNGNGTGYDMYVWNEPTNCWIYKLNTTSPVNWNTVHPGADFMVGRGYLYSVQAANPTKTFIGNLNNGSMSYGLTSSSANESLKGFNLVGNPYPSSIDWSAASGWDRTKLVGSGGGFDMWIWNPVANNYGVYNSTDADGIGTNSTTRYLAPMQGFFVRAATAGNLIMQNDVRVPDNATWFKTLLQEENKVSLCVKSDAGYGYDEIQLSFGYSDNENGARKLFSEVLSAPSIYLPNRSDILSVVYYTNTKENPVVPVCFIPGMDGHYTISCNFDQSMFDIVMLEDRQKDYIQNMKAANAYSFTAKKTDDANRFVLYFGPDKNHSYNELPARIYADAGHLIVDLVLVPEETEVFVYDLMGHLVVKQKLTGEIRHTLNFISDTQILIVCLKNQSGHLYRKLLWIGNRV